MPEQTGLIYRLEERPPLGALFLLASQHMIVAVSYTVFAVMTVRAAGS